MNMKYLTLFSVFILSLNVAQAKDDLKNNLPTTYGSSYSTVEMLLNSGMTAFEALCQIPDDSVNNGILQGLNNTYYPRFSTILMLYKSNKKSYDNLNN